MGQWSSPGLKKINTLTQGLEKLILTRSVTLKKWCHSIASTARDGPPMWLWCCDTLYRTCWRPCKRICQWWEALISGWLEESYAWKRSQKPHDSNTATKSGAGVSRPGCTNNTDGQHVLGCHTNSSQKSQLKMKTHSVERKTHQRCSHHIWIKSI